MPPPGLLGGDVGLHRRGVSRRRGARRERGSRVGVRPAPRRSFLETTWHSASFVRQDVPCESEKDHGVILAHLR